MTLTYSKDGFVKPPKGTWRFKVTSKPEEGRTSGGKVMRRFFFDLLFPDGNTQEYQETFFPWLENYRDLLIALGGEEDEKGKVTIKDELSLTAEEAIIGREVLATIIYEPARDRSGKEYSRMTNIVAAGEPMEDTEAEAASSEPPEEEEKPGSPDKTEPEPPSDDDIPF